MDCNNALTRAQNNRTLDVISILSLMLHDVDSVFRTHVNHHSELIVIMLEQQLVCTFIIEIVEGES